MQIWVPDRDTWLSLIVSVASGLLYIDSAADHLFTVKKSILQDRCSRCTSDNCTQTFTIVQFSEWQSELPLLRVFLWSSNSKGLIGADGVRLIALFYKLTEDNAKRGAQSERGWAKVADIKSVLHTSRRGSVGSFYEWPVVAHCSVRRGIRRVSRQGVRFLRGSCQGHARPLVCSPRNRDCHRINHSHRAKVSRYRCVSHRARDGQLEIAARVTYRPATLCPFV